MLPVTSSGVAGEQDTVPRIREQVVELKPGHFHKADAFPWFIPGSPAIHHLWMEVGGREEREEEDGERCVRESRSDAYSSSRTPNVETMLPT